MHSPYFARQESDGWYVCRHRADEPGYFRYVPVGKIPPGIPQLSLKYATREEAQAECDRRNLDKKRKANERCLPL